MAAISRTKQAGGHARAGMGAASALHPLAWAAWLVSALAMIFLTANPLYIATIAAVALVVYAAHRRSRALDGLLVAGIALAVLTFPLNLVTGSTGAHEIAELPAYTFPGWLGRVTLGGPVTAESLVYAGTQASGIAAILIAAFAFNSGVDHFRLLKSMPSGLSQLGIVLSVGLLLAPETVARAATLREARAVRGHGRGGAGAIVALALPLLADALERSVQRAESLDARGFGRLQRRRGSLAAAAGVTGLAIAASGAFSLYYTSHDTLPLLAICGGGSLLVTAIFGGRAPAATRLRPQRLAAADACVLAASVAALAIFAAQRALGVGGLAYLPFPSIEPPAYAAPSVLAALLLAAPAIFPRRDEAPQ